MIQNPPHLLMNSFTVIVSDLDFSPLYMAKTNIPEHNVKSSHINAIFGIESSQARSKTLGINIRSVPRNIATFRI